MRLRDIRVSTRLMVLFGLGGVVGAVIAGFAFVVVDHLSNEINTLDAQVVAPQDVLSKMVAAHGAATASLEVIKATASPGGPAQGTAAAHASAGQGAIAARETAMASWRQARAQFEEAEARLGSFAAPPGGDTEGLAKLQEAVRLYGAGTHTTTAALEDAWRDTNAALVAQRAARDSLADSLDQVARALAALHKAADEGLVDASLQASARRLSGLLDGARREMSGERGAPPAGSLERATSRVALAAALGVAAEALLSVPPSAPAPAAGERPAEAAGGAPRAALAKTIDDAAQALKAAIGALGEARRARDKALGRERRASEAQGTLLAGVGKTLAGAGAAMAAQARSTRDAAAATADAGPGRLAVVGGLAILLGLLGGWLAARQIVTPLTEVRRACRRIAQGDLSQEITYDGRDEVGRMAESFRELQRYVRDKAAAAQRVARGDLSVQVTPSGPDDVLARHLSEVVDAVQGVTGELGELSERVGAGDPSARTNAEAYPGAFGQVAQQMNAVLDAIMAPMDEVGRGLAALAEGDLTARLPTDFRGAFGTFAASFNQALASIEGQVVAVASAAAQVQAAAAQIAATSQALAEGATEQASALEETSSALEEISAMSRSNADNAEGAADRAGQARDTASEATDAVEHMVSSVERIRDSSQDTAQIIGDINEIAFQTNLLSLNSAVEAARAGEAGRGFAVVADEVRTLALRSKEAAKKTEDLIKDSVGLAGEGVAASREVAQKLTAIVAAVSDVQQQMEQIRRASQEQVAGIEQVNASVSDMDRVTQSNAASSEESSSAAEELRAQADEMVRLVEGFETSTGRELPGGQGAGLFQSGAPEAGPMQAWSAPRPRGGNGNHGLGFGFSEGLDAEFGDDATLAEF